MHTKPPRLPIVVAAALLLCLVPPLRSQQPVAETVADAAPEAAPIEESPITDSDRTHWAFRPIGRPPLPPLESTDWLQTAVDAFILARLQANGLSPAPPASRATLLRRLSFDLAGLPPAPDELVAFESEQSPDAYERLVDRLLASPAFGERYGQHWLDLARFAETDGFEHDKLRPEAWRYRDWVIAALNADMPYDEFIRLQIAGDERQERSESASFATMFGLAGPDMPDVNDQDERRHHLLNDLTATVGSVFLGLQLGCAQCHDHKYDPLSQGDFYRLRAFFEPAVAPLKRDVPFNMLAIQPDAPPARFWIRGDHRRPGPLVQPAFPRIASSAADVSPLAARDSLRSELARWLVREDHPLTGRVIANRLWQFHFGRGICQTPSDFGAMGGPVTHPELLDWLAVELRTGGWAMKQLHRLIVSSSTYRQESTNPEFQTQNSESEVDAGNDLYSRFPRRRLEGEAIRDALLASGGLLTSERGGPGVMPPLPQELVGTLLKNQWTVSSRQADHYRRSIYVFARRNLRYPLFEAFDRPDGNASCPERSRSTTAPQSLLLLNSELSLLAARHLAGRVLRGEQPKAQQAEEVDFSRWTERMYLIALSRRPAAEEIALLKAFLGHQRQRLAAEARPPEELALPVPLPDAADPYAAAALVDACLALLNANEFVYVD